MTPGCGTPAAWTQAHHIQHWADGGETVLANMVLLCSRHHHTSIHTQGWEVTIGADGHPWFRPPHITTGRKDWMPCHQRRSHTLTHAA
ncbi:HNH endonuclease [Gordonia sp. X0973]|uniref:HNH endonuclease signature motif containing protein n=1 Tax=Gordonia sp. X0973 TaxID=2742602 RepID=UPI000F54713B|nr:HNH endonuclease signature motif containing protein [Gordonia sp. X0973]QKT06586.1 HNH endonuclease [Gordonia sp. X0973]